MADNYLVFNDAEAVHYGDAVKGTYLMEVVIPTEPTAGDARKFGLYSKNRDVGIYFEVTGTTFRGVAVDGNKNKEVTEDIEFNSAWAGAPIEYKIIWEAGRAELYVDRVHRATVDFSEDDLALAVHPMSLYIYNGNSDDMLVGAIEARNIYRYS